MRLFWYLIPQDGPYPWRTDGQRKIDYSYLRQLSTTIDHLGYEGALVAGGGGGHELWTLSSFMAANTTRMKFVVAQHPGRTSPMLIEEAYRFHDLVVPLLQERRAHSSNTKEHRAH